MQECNKVPGHSRCKRVIKNGKCPSEHHSVASGACEGHAHNLSANTQRAAQWLLESKDSSPTQTIGFTFVP